ncbi:uncharacterized protein LOC133318132 [Gastrolobium bilobum]|uniref:uncharacterized protein LOC133318132 n=1 Tax=Gastrolobium bilobum TaxID=150636 RepID=UPI002AAFC382|nr:uncharacterized protein LOC133318132 [Gastrolobium bilobum]
MRLNPRKCAFGVPAGKFLGVMLTERGLEVNPDKCKVVIEMRSPQTVKEVQQLTGRLVALTRFLVNSAHKSLPLFDLLKKGTSFQWSDQCEKAFQALSCPPVLTKPDSGETLYLYLTVGAEAISATLVREPKEGHQPIYFVSKVLQGAKLRYQQVEKVALTLIFAARRHSSYFQCHPITVRTNQPIRLVLHKPDLDGRMMSQAIELSEYQISYEPRTAIKVQALTYFIAEMSHTCEAASQATETPRLALWKLYVDGSTNAKGSGARMIIENPDSVAMEHSLSFNFNTTNNQAEYETMIVGLLQAKELGAQHLKVFSDSQLIRRSENTRADILAKLASTKSPGNNRSVIQRNLHNPSIVMSIADVTEGVAEDTWITPISNYLSEGTLPVDQTEAKRIKRKCAHFCMMQGRLYKRGFSTPLLKFLNPGDVGYILEEIHEEINGHHMGGHFLAKKALRAGMDLLGPFPEAAGRVQWLIVAIDYFTKWVEAEPVATITSQRVRKFFWRNIVYRFGIPGEVITDNGTQFTDAKF